MKPKILITAVIILGLGALGVYLQLALSHEREPWIDTQGRLTRAYVFADGHSELRIAPDGDFQRIEQEIRDREQ